MSTSNETTSFVNEAESNETDSSLEKKVGLAKKFDKEMKDYAKATVKEFLGIYGYEEDVDINMEDSTEGLPNRSESSTISSNPTQTEANFKQPENRSPCEAISSAASTMAAGKCSGENRSSPVTSVSISSSTNNPIRNLNQPYVESTERRDWEPRSSHEVESEEKRVYGDTSERIAPCRWCRKVGRLQNFTYRSEDGKLTFYEDLCSKICFEGVKRVRLGKDVVVSCTDNRIPDNATSNFSWDIYLTETHGTAAPWTCFKQSSAPPFNGFQPGMKLEAADPRNDGTVCVATVVSVLGSRLRLRFDGCDTANDIWRMVDSGDIHPIGWCEGNGGVLQPPVGFRWDVGKFSSFLAKTLTNGELAPLRFFKKEPHTPKTNYFAPTHKLEAVDLTNPVLICVATVVEVVGEHIKIVFDGWKSSKYTYRYDSRDIYPVGWCYFSGHPLQPPGPEFVKVRQPSTDKYPMFSPTVRPHDIPSHPSVPQHSRGSPALQADSATADEAADYWLNLGASRTSLRVEMLVHHACDPGPYLDPVKVVDLPHFFRGRVRDVLQCSIQAIVNAAFNQKTVLGFLQPGRGKVVIRAEHGHDTFTCCLQNVDRVTIFWNVITRFSDNLRCCKNLLSGVKVQGTCAQCKNHGDKVATKIRREIIENNIKAVHDIERVETGVPIVERREPVVERGEHNVEKREPVVERGEPLAAKIRRVSVEVDEAAVGSTSSPTTWSTDEVVKYFKTSDISQYAEIFRDHEIDGGALLLLNRETIMSCMQFKLGPTLKLLNHIEQLKTRFAL